MKKQQIFFTILCIFLLGKCTTGAMISLTDFIIQERRRTSPDGSVKCKVGQIYADGKGCIFSCQKLLKEVDCSDVFGQFVDDGACAYGGNGVWQYFGSKCSACDHGYNGYFVGKCEALRPQIDVGKPLNSPYWSNLMPGVQVCKDFQIYTRQRGCIKTCSHPDFKTCSNAPPFPVISYFCGFTIQGTWISLGDSCQACPLTSKPTKFIGLAEGKCEDTPPKINPLNQVPGKCNYHYDCPQPAQKCFLGKCISRCSGMLCESGTICLNGICTVLDQQQPQCKSDVDCSPIQSCTSGKCVTRRTPCGNSSCKLNQKCVYGKCLGSTTDKCATVKCSAGSTCKDGSCVSDVTTCSYDQQCRDQEKCTENKCQYGCSTVKCGGGYACIHGGCRPERKKCASSAQCTSQEKCRSGLCVEKCSGVFCPLGQFCVQGSCEKNRCAAWSKSCVQTPLGLVMKVFSFDDKISKGWRRLKISEGRRIKDYLNQLLEKWSIVAFETGKLDGFGYGNVFSETYGPECGQLFIVEATPFIPLGQ